MTTTTDRRQYQRAYYERNREKIVSVLLLNANALHIPLADESVNCCVTSPPYYGLRSYDGDQMQIWGGDETCAHEWGEKMSLKKTGGVAHAMTYTVNQFVEGKSYFCVKCGAWYGALGLEPTPELFVEHLVMIFREVRRVLSMDGTLWLNIGDSYAGSGGPGSWVDNKQTESFKGEFKKYDNPNRKVSGIKPKDLIGIPWMVAFALRADGWYLRSDIIWHKPNPMPESVTDRPTKSHEYIFLLSKSRDYYYDYKAISEPLAGASIARLAQDVQNQNGSTRANGGAKTNGPMKAVTRKHKSLEYDGQRPNSTHIARANGEKDNQYTARNKRSVWTIATQPYSGAHFATYPPALIEPCIKAGCPEGGIVLDPFAGSGTTALVARKLNRYSVCLDLSLSYLQTCARPRLQLSDLEEFYSGKKAENNFEGLPLFDTE